MYESKRNNPYGHWEGLHDSYSLCLDALNSLREYPKLIKQYSEYLNEDYRRQASHMLNQLLTDSKMYVERLDQVAARHKNKHGIWYSGRIHTEAASMTALEISAEYAGLLDAIQHSLVRPFESMVAGLEQAASQPETLTTEGQDNE